MKHSIKRQMACMSIGLVVFMLVAFLIINGKFLEQYYVANKQKDFARVYEVLEKKAKGNNLKTEDTIEALTKYTEKGNISLAVVDESGNLVLRTSREEGLLQGQLMGYLLSKNQGSGTLLEETEQYQIRRLTDSRNKMEYVEMWGNLSNDYFFILRSPLESIRESVALSNRFLGYVGSVVIFLSILLVWYFSKKITNPILELAELSRKMADLDFDAKYTSGGDNEIGVLGANFNTMSERLEGAVSKLKTANYELQKDIEQKEKIDTMRTDFIGNVSHELKTPIALIQGYAEGLKEGINEDATSREFYCDVIMDEANKMNQMVKNLLTLNQLECGAQDTQFERFDIVDLIQGVVQSYEILIQQKSVVVQFQQNESIYVWADEFKVEQVVRNYITNAFNHVNEGKLIEIKVNQDAEKAKISIFNTGIPIPKEDVEHIWDKFYKVDKARTREYGGNGIGLSIVKAIMDSLHQEYGLENYSNGVEFWFELDMK